MNPAFSYQLEATAGGARAGLFRTPRGVVRTPCFMPVGTRGSVKGVLPRDLRAAGSQIILANTFHLLLRPGEATVERLGELHGFMQYDGPILTDSGGFQVFSLKDLREISEAGVKFKSPIDGSAHFLSPERAMEVQRALGANIVMAFDECPPAEGYSDAQHEASMARTLRWLERCLTVPLKPHQTMFPIVQGAMQEERRVRSARATLDLMPNANGYAVGGLAVGEERSVTYRMLETSLAELPTDRPRYLMGVGTPGDLIDAVDRGIDLFDCVLPTRNARHGKLFVRGGTINLKNARFREDAGPIEEGCDCLACTGGFSRGYLHHLLRVGEQLSDTLLSLHNTRFLLRQCEEMRAAILAGTWEDWKAANRPGAA